MATMKVVQFMRYGGPEVVSMAEAERPQPGSGELAIRVHAAGVNPINWKTREGGFRIVADYSMPFVPGWDLSGEVADVGPNVDGFQTGQAVLAMTGVKAGTFAEYAIAKAGWAAHKPELLDQVEAAALPLSALTAWQALFDQGGLTAGQTVLIHGAAGAVGGIAVQLARRAGARVIATVRGKDVGFVRQLGADEVIDTDSTQFEQVAHNVDLVLDVIGGDVQVRSWATLKRGGVLVSTPGPPDADAAAKHGVRGVSFVAAPNGSQLAEVAHLAAEDSVRADIATTFPLREAGRALEVVKAGGVHGKIVVLMDLISPQREALN